MQRLAKLAIATFALALTFVAIVPDDASAGRRGYYGYGYYPGPYVYPRWRGYGWGYGPYAYGYTPYAYYPYWRGRYARRAWRRGWGY
jgi:hypothetical protein